MHSKLLHRRNCCRLCSSNELSLILKLAPCPPVDAFTLITEKPLTEEYFPMDLYLCNSCGHAQLLDVVSPAVLFGNYIYTTTSSPGLVEYFRVYAEQTAAFLNLTAGAKAIDIGSNDGTLLRFLKGLGMEVLGVDPAKNIADSATASGIPTIAKFLTKATSAEIQVSWGKADLVTANNVFAHSDDLADMLEGARDLLKPEGTFVFEVSYLLDLVQGKVFDFIYHEHLSHHSVKPLKLFLHSHGMKLLHVQRNQSKGGSIRCFAKLAAAGGEETPSVNELILLEESSGLYALSTYESLTAEISAIGHALRERLIQLHARGASIAAYGASATGTVLLHHFDVGKFVNYIIDDNPDRQGRLSPGHKIPVVSSDVLTSNPPDCVLILAWRFARQIIEKHAGFSSSGGHFIIPLPELSQN